ncbi:hypothetical protein COLO4_05272 [Corchorus olitorius]|uniref:DUF4378 domain-containing protein n=1 Tax=Corchorus olitorius TaxID=93759 RepID=A0A1R3KRE4_9ROSI|nr:hypothetical protein COLO4_05272 [Corchorus olitorius]
MLKDYLRDDLSSCSSSGFKSFPRRQCCTTIRFLLEADLKKSKDYYSSNTAKRLLKRKSSKQASTAAISALQKASEAFLKAVKLLPFASIKPSTSRALQSNGTSKKGLLPRSFSRRLFSRSFWRKAEKIDDGGGGEVIEIRQWRSFREFLEEKNQPSDQNNIGNVNTTDTCSSIITTTTSRVSTSSTSGNSNSWAESEFTVDIFQSSSGNSENSNLNGVVEDKTNLPEKEKVSNIVGVTVGEEASINYTKEQKWRNEEGKEQFSPVSILDCPFDDEEENNSPSFQDKLERVEGTKQKLMQKIRRFESLAQLEPVDLEKRIALAEHEDGNNNKQDKFTEANEKLLKQLKSKYPSDCFYWADNLLLDFFSERMVEDEGVLIELELVKVAEDWINGNPQEVILGWEVQEGRKAYVKEMERIENWRSFDEEKEEVGLKVELEVFSWLVDELLTDLF